MAVQAQVGSGFVGCLPPYDGNFAEQQIWAAKDYGALQFAAANNGGYHCAPGVVSGARSELTCNGSGGGVGVSWKKRGREEADPLEWHVSSSAAALLPPFPTTQNASRITDAATASTSGRTCAPGTTTPSMVLLSELCRSGAEIDALVRAECERLRAGLERARKRQCSDLARAVLGAAARRLREEAEADAARRRSAELEERARQAAAESRAWCGLARGHEAVAGELRAALDRHLVLRCVEGAGESAAADDAESCCFVEAKDSTSPARGKWACKACGEGEASVLLLPCRHLCLCKACEPRLDACPVCLAAKNASIHVARN